MYTHYSTAPKIKVQHGEIAEYPVAVRIDCHFCFGDGCQECGWTGDAYVINDEDENPDQ